MWQMPFSLLYLAANLATLGVLVRSKYYRLWGIFAAQLAVTCWQIGVLAIVGTVDRQAVVSWWLPGDILLVFLCGAAVLEVLWHAMRGFPARNKLMVCGFAVVAMHFAGLSIRWIFHLPTYADWFAQARADRAIANLCIATLAIIAAGIAHSFNRHNDPRFVRLHATLIAVLAVGHVLLSDASRWSESHTAYRALELACCLGWLINANLIAREMHWVGLPVAAREAVAPAQCVPAVRSSPLPERGGFGGRHWAARSDAWMPQAPSETQ